MKPSDSQIEEYKKSAEELVQEWLKNTAEEPFVKTCKICNTPLRDDSITGDTVVFIVTTLGAFMDHDSTVHYRCPNHAEDAEKLVQRLLTSRVVAITGTVEQNGDRLSLNTKSIEYYEKT